VVKPAPIV
jgi:hypothetical protein